MPQPRRITWLVSMQRLQLFAVCLTVVHKDAEDLLPIFSYSLQFPTIQANIVRVGKQVYLLYKLPQIATRKQTGVSTAAAINTSIKSVFQYYTACDIPPPYAQLQPCLGFSCPLSWPVSTYNPALSQPVCGSHQFMRKCSEGHMGHAGTEKQN